MAHMRMKFTFLIKEKTYTIDRVHAFGSHVIERAHSLSGASILNSGNTKIGKFYQGLIVCIKKLLFHQNKRDRKGR